MAPMISVLSIFLLFIAVNAGAIDFRAENTGGLTKKVRHQLEKRYVAGENRAIDIRAENTGRGLTKKSLANSVNKFGCNLLSGVFKNAAAEDNVLVSPFNAYAALALLHLGAGEKTRKELSAVMKLSESSTEVHEQLSAIFSQISPPKKNNLESPHYTYYETKLANGIFLQKDFSIKPKYVELAKKYYDSSAESLDFVHQAKESTDHINQWVSGKTNGRISKFYEDPLSSHTIAVLVSALYFNAKWSNTFEVENTKTEKFNTGLKEIEVPMMHMERRMTYSTDDTLHYDSVSLPYSGKEHYMTVYLQHTQHGDHGSLSLLFHHLAEQNFAPNTTVKSDRRYVDLKLPKMKFSWKNSVVEALKLRTIFDTVDLGEMTASKNIKVTDMLHATEIEVNENGTIASATTALEVSLTSGYSPDPRAPVKFYVNRPFLVTISNQPTGAILFAGIVRKPMK